MRHVQPRSLALVLAFALVVNVTALALTRSEAHAQSSCSVTFTIHSLRNTNDNPLNTVPNPLSGLCVPSQWQYDVWSKIYDDDGPVGNGPNAADLNIPCQPASSSSCPVANLTVNMGSIDPGEYIRITSDRDLAGGAVSFNIAECGTVTPVMTAALGNDYRNTVSATCEDGEAINVSVTYYYSTGG